MTRGKLREQAILTSTLALLQQQGYDALTIDAVAAAARASKATIYRRWSNKAALVAAALDALDASDNAAIADTGALRSDLVAVMKATQRKATKPYVAMISELVVAARRDAELAGHLRRHVEREGLSPFHEALRRARDRREVSADLDPDLIHDVAEAMILRQLQIGAAFDARFIARVVDRVLLPLTLQTMKGKR
ncbi:Transcriptional regulator, TetR family protein [Minicystis rosea]|nr:Transcriptional regulator, TetR family protein [Minicystis rosea]